MDEDEEFGDVYTDLPPVSVNSQIEPLEPSEGPVLAEASAPPQAGDRPEEAGARSSDGPSPDPALDAPRAWEEALDGEREQLFAGFSGRMEPQVVVAELQRRQQEAETLRTELGTSQAAQAELHASLSAMALENIRLRDALAAAQRAAEPSVVQLRQVLLDPAVNAELARLKRELERRSGRGPDDPATGRAGKRGPPGFTAAPYPRAPKGMEEVQAAGPRQEPFPAAGGLKQVMELGRAELRDLQAAYDELESRAHALEEERDTLQRQLRRRHAAEKYEAALNGKAVGAAPAVPRHGKRAHGDADMRGSAPSPRAAERARGHAVDERQDRRRRRS
uniref:Uncharacterized protein n=1 Tax=Auxenochlorella protothecoides TaxID=3075 RepID=A0A1D1ZY07_AUXPR